MHLCSADLYEEDNLLPFKGVLFRQISQYQRSSHFTAPETNVVVMMMVIIIHGYTHHYLQRLVWGLDFLESCSFNEISYYSGSLVVMKEIHIWKSIAFSIAYFKFNFGEEKKEFKFISKLFSLSGREVVHPVRFLMIFGKSNAILIRKKKSYLRRMKDNSIMTKNSVGYVFVASCFHKKVK